MRFELLIVMQAAIALGDFNGIGTYPAPRDLTSSKSQVKTAWENITTTLNKAIQSKSPRSAGQLAGIYNISFSMGMFSLHDKHAAQLQFHHTAPEIMKSPNGTNKVDQDSIYEVASVSKLITTYTGLVSLKPEDWHKPLTELNPNFKHHSNGAAADDPIMLVQWDQVTPWALATQLSGIPTIGDPWNDLYTQALQAGAKFTGPSPDLAAWSPCAVEFLQDGTFCGAPEVIRQAAIEAPNFLPWSTPAYSDLNFMLLGVLISNITGKPLTEVYHEKVFQPLGMTSSFENVPPTKALIDRCVIPGGNYTAWAIEPSFYAPSGGLRTTLSDLQKFGLGILNSTLLPADTTRKWLKPVSQSSSLTFAIGAPWEIYRFLHPSGKVTDLYTKIGDDDKFGAAQVIIPEYDVGFSLLNGASDTNRSNDARVILDYVASSILPALEAQSLAEAKANFIGKYESTDSQHLASITIAFNKTGPLSVHSELTVTKWKYNGTDVLSTEQIFQGVHPRLEQSIPSQSGAGLPGKVAFQLSPWRQGLTYESPDKKADPVNYGPWTGTSTFMTDFWNTDQYRWAGRPTRTFVFETDENGRATALIPLWDGIKLKRCD